MAWRWTGAIIEAGDITVYRGINFVMDDKLFRSSLIVVWWGKMHHFDFSVLIISISLSRGAVHDKFKFISNI